jgi:hypothetical protein
MNTWRLECEHVKQAISVSELYFVGSKFKWWGMCKSLLLYKSSIECRGSVSDTIDSVSRGNKLKSPTIMTKVFVSCLSISA